MYVFIIVYMQFLFPLLWLFLYFFHSPSEIIFFTIQQREKKYKFIHMGRGRMCWNYKSSIIAALANNKRHIRKSKYILFFFLLENETAEMPFSFTQPFKSDGIVCTMEWKTIYTQSLVLFHYTFFPLLLFFAFLIADVIVVLFSFFTTPTYACERDKQLETLIV